MPLHSEISIIGEFFKLHHLENPGMAFGINFDFKYTKLILSLFRLVASFIIGFYLYNLIQKKSNFIILICISLILSGAIGNVIDSVFYGIIFNNSPPEAPFDLFYGQVIDMFYIDIWEGYISNSIPIIGGSYFSLWPVFNLADSYIFIGVAVLLIFQKKFIGEI
jgi:signal peptidase II|tara:strand:- start:1087 stop:1578 length:492 start_codon:yes stop_codon:yes gene_type:complete